MCAYGAHFGSLLTDHDMTAVGALPDNVVVLGEYEVAFDIRKKLSVTLLVFLFDLANSAEKICDVVKSLFLCNSFEFSVHICPLITLACGSVFKICCGCGDSAVVKKLKPNLCVLLLVFCCFLEDFCYLYISVFFRF